MAAQRGSSVRDVTVLVVKPWKSRIVQPAVILALGAWPALFWHGSGPAARIIAVIACVSAASIVGRLARSRLEVRIDGSVVVKAILRDYSFPAGSFALEVGHIQTLFTLITQPCLVVASGGRRHSFWTLSDTSDDRVDEWLLRIERALASNQRD